MAEVKPDVVNNAVDDDEDEENQEEELKQEVKDEFLLKACKENNLEEAQLWLSKQASPICEKDGWNPLLWAASAAGQDGDGDKQNGAGVQQSASGEEEYDPFVKPKDA